jgi:hypothetical protein
LRFVDGAGIDLYAMVSAIVPVEPGDYAEKGSSWFSQSEAVGRRAVSGLKQVEGDDQARLQRPMDGQMCTQRLMRRLGKKSMWAAPPDSPSEEEETRRQLVGGLVLVGVGVLFALRNLFPWIEDLSDVWPLFVIGLGLLLIVRGSVE